MTHQKLLEFGGEIMSSIGDVKITNHENEYHCTVDVGSKRLESTTMSNNPTTFNFPTDIIRCIIEFATWNDYKTAQNLELVNHNFRIWTGPAFYQTVLLHTTSSLIGFSELIRSALESSPDHATSIARDNEFYARNVRCLGISRSKVPRSIFEPIFLVCSSVEILELDGVVLSGTVTMKPTEYITPTNHINIVPLYALENVTHLWSNVPHHYTSLSFPPRLTHLGLIFLTSDLLNFATWLRRVLALPLLEVLILTFQEPAASINEPPVTPSIFWEIFFTDFLDSRLVVRAKKGYELESESQRAREMGMSIWTYALQDGKRHPKLSGIKLAGSDNLQSTSYTDLETSDVNTQYPMSDGEVKCKSEKR